MPNVVKNKVFLTVFVVAMVLLSSVCFCVLNWSYIVSCTHGLEETRVGILQKKGLTCVGSTNVEPGNYAGITVYLQELDEEGDWVSINAWEDQDLDIAVVDTEYATGTGTFRLKLTHKAYLPDDLETPVEMHYSETDEVVID